MVKVQPGHCPSSAPVPRQGAPDGLGPLGPLGAPRERPAHWAPGHCLGCPCEPPRHSPTPAPLTLQARPLQARLQGPPHQPNAPVRHTLR